MNIVRRCHRIPVGALLLLLAGCATRGEPLHEVDSQLEQGALAAGADAERRGDHDGALVEYVKALAENPQSAEAHYRAARVHAALGNAQTAQQAYERALRIRPDHVGALEGLGLLLLGQGEHDAAREALEKAAARDAARWLVLNGLGVLADLDGRHAAARSLFGKALELEPDSPRLLNNLGYSYYLSGEYGAAKTHFERALAADPDHRNAWSNLALVHTRRGEYEAAVQALENIMDAPSARHSVGYVCVLEGKLADAERLFADAVRTSTSYNAVAQTALKRVRDEQARTGISGASKF